MKPPPRQPIDTNMGGGRPIVERTGVRSGNAVIALFVFLALFGGFLVVRATSSSLTEPLTAPTEAPGEIAEPVAEGQPTPTPRLSAADISETFKVRGVRVDFTNAPSGDIWRIAGQVANISDEMADTPQVLISLTDNQGQTAASTQVGLRAERLPPGQRLPFAAELTVAADGRPLTPVISLLPSE